MDQVKSAVPVSAIGLMLLLHAPAYGCSCVPKEPPERSLERAHAVFTGEVEHVESRLVRTALIVAWIGFVKVRSLFGAPELHEISEPDELRFIGVRLRVLQRFKGDLESAVWVRTGLGGGDCGFPFVRGHQYLVYAYGSGDQLSTSICSRTQDILTAESEIQLLAEAGEGP